MINESHKKDSEIHSDFNEEIQKEIQQDLLDDQHNQNADIGLFLN